MAMLPDYTQRPSANPATRPDHGGVLPLTGLVAPLIGLGIVLFLMGMSGVWLYFRPLDLQFIVTLMLALTTMGGLLVIISIFWVRQRLVTPLTNLRNWMQRIRNGDLTALASQTAESEMTGYEPDITGLSDSLRTITRNMKEQVRQHTRHLERKTRSLEILYDVAASSNSARDIDELLTRFLHTLTEILYAHAGTVRLVTDDNRLRLVAAVGIDDSLLEGARLIPLERCMCALDQSTNVVVCKSTATQCPTLLGQLQFPHNQLDNIAIPLRYKNQPLGIYHLFVERLGLSDRIDIQDILTNIGQHLSLAIEKSRMDEESSRYSIMQERAMLAHELHDSLAQTLASLRFQVHNVSHALLQENASAAQAELSQLKAGIDEANGELRELLAHFRVPMDERGLIPATEAVAERFRKESGIALFFQNESGQVRLPPLQEVHVLHIIQEALANIRKHSGAHNVRLLMRHDVAGRYHVLVEDDGIGIDGTTWDGPPGEHVGLTIMQERAKRIGGSLIIESEPGEGTRVELIFAALPSQGGTDDLPSRASCTLDDLSAPSARPH